jgi:hypothetical protein
MKAKGPKTQEQYEANIPKCCVLQTYKEHCDHLMLCWSIVSGTLNANSECGKACEYHKEHDPELLRRILHGLKLEPYPGAHITTD